MALEKLGARFGNVSHRISPQADPSSRERLRRDPYYVPIEIEIDDDDRDEVRRIIEAINVTTDVANAVAAAAATVCRREHDNSPPASGLRPN